MQIVATILLGIITVIFCFILSCFCNHSTIVVICTFRLGTELMFRRILVIFLFCPMQNQAKFLLIFNSSMIIGFTLFLDAREILAYSVRNKECQPSQALRAKPNV